MKKHVMFVEQYAHASPLRNKSASLKTGFSAAVLLLCLILDSTAVSLWIMLSMASASVIWGKVRLRDYLRLLSIPLFFLVFSGIGLLLAVGDVWRTLHVTLRAMGAVSAFYFLILSTPVDSVLSVLGRWHVPSVLIDLMYLIYRFIFVLTDVCHSMHIAAQSRLGYTDYRTSLTAFGGIGSNLLTLSMKRADDCYNAMLARGYEGIIRFMEPKGGRNTADVCMAAFYLVVTTAIRRFCG